MKIERRFPLQVLLTLVVAFAIALYPLMRMDSRDVLIAVIVGALLSTLNVLAGFLAIERTLGRSYEAFLKAVLGGMGVRMLVMLGTLALLMKIVGLHTIGLVISVLSFHVVFLVLELMYIQRRVSTIQKN
ncbi:MAG: hypothetical protein ACKVRP_15905 [Bacteroidota bacterium]